MSDYNTITINTDTPNGLETSIITLNFLDFFALLFIPFIFVLSYRLFFPKKR